MTQKTSITHFSNKNLSVSARTYVLLVSIFLGILLVTNAITTKYIKIAHFTLTAGAITYPFTFTLLDIIAEVYGSKRAKLAVWMGLIASLLMTLIVKLAILTPVYSQSIVSQQAFQLLFGFTPGILFGSMAAYLIAQLVDIYLFGWIRRLTHGRHLWFRNVASTLISQLLDTLIFGWVAWILWPSLTTNKAITPLSWDTWYQLTLNEYLFKVAFTLCSIPLVYLGVHAIRRWIKI
jgi:hypothetical protein